MFDIGWSELLIIGVMALIVMGPKDLIVMMRTGGRYLGMIRRQASEFRAQFDEALRETEFDQIRKDVAGIKQDVSSTVREAGRQVERDLDGAKMDQSVKATIDDGKKPGSSADHTSPGDDGPEQWVSDEEPDLKPAPATAAAKSEAKAVEGPHRAHGSAEKTGV